MIGLGVVIGLGVGVVKLYYELSTGMNKKHHTAAVFVDFALHTF